MEEKKGRTAARQLCIKSNTRVRQDTHAHGKRKLRCRHITDNNRSGKENVAYLYHYLCLTYGVSGGLE